jgi:hypothetical protein
MDAAGVSAKPSTASASAGHRVSLSHQRRGCCTVSVNSEVFQNLRVRLSSACARDGTMEAEVVGKERMECGVSCSRFRPGAPIAGLTVAPFLPSRPRRRGPWAHSCSMAPSPSSHPALASRRLRSDPAASNPAASKTFFRYGFCVLQEDDDGALEMEWLGVYEPL